MFIVHQFLCYTSVGVSYYTILYIAILHGCEATTTTYYVAKFSMHVHWHSRL